LRPEQQENRESKLALPTPLVVDCGEVARAILKGLYNAQIIDLLFRVLMRLSPAVRWRFQHAQWTLGIETPHEWAPGLPGLYSQGAGVPFQEPHALLIQ
jgi:hypothetical protein